MPAKRICTLYEIEIPEPSRKRRPDLNSLDAGFSYLYFTISSIVKALKIASKFHIMQHEMQR